MRGLRNNGNTCYFNTSLQCLLNIPVLSNHLIDNPYTGECEFTKLYSDLVNTYWSKTHKGVINAQPLLNAFQKHFKRFVIGEQHDVQEAILCIIDVLEREIPEIKTWFYGKKVQQVVWPEGKKNTEETFCMHLVNSDSKDLGEMLEKSTGWSVIENFEDDNGKVFNVATTRTIFSKLPKILMISFNSKSHFKVVERIFIDNFEYNLLSSAIHMGVQYDGHYVTFSKRRGVWYYINDVFAHESPLPTEAGHYVLVYNLKTPSSGYLP
jgi:ubiquitin C-terminal hydrolase